MRTLIAIGYWQSEHEPDFPAIKDFVNNTISQDERKLLLNYLDKGMRLHEWMGYSSCRFKCGIPGHQMGNACLTDGKYIWPEKLSHYISEHNVWLPEQFILHVKENQHYNPDELNVKEDQFGNYDWWKSVKP